MQYDLGETFRDRDYSTGEKIHTKAISCGGMTQQLDESCVGGGAFGGE